MKRRDSGRDAERYGDPRINGAVSDPYSRPPTGKDSGASITRSRAEAIQHLSGNRSSYPLRLRALNQQAYDH